MGACVFHRFHSCLIERFARSSVHLLLQSPAFSVAFALMIVAFALMIVTVALMIVTVALTR